MGFTRKKIAQRKFERALDRAARPVVLTASWTTLYQWDSRRGGAWEQVVDFAPAGLTEVTRLAVSPKGDRLAIVAVPKAP